MVTAAQEILDLPAGGFLYEPRSFWDIASFELTADAQVVRFNREHFRNGERWPITVNRIALSGINYLLQTMPTAGQIFPYQTSGSVGASAQIAVTPPFRQHYGRNPVLLNTMNPRPTSMPQPRTAFASSLWGQCALTFDKPLYLPQRGNIQWDISAGYIPAGDPDDPEVPAYMLFQEEGGLFAGSARTFDFLVRGLQAGAWFPSHLDPNVPVPTQERWPYVPDAYTWIYGTDPGNSTDFWDPAGGFSGREFDRQEATRAGTTKVLGVRTMIDQIAHDEYINALPNLAPTVVEPLSTRLGARIKTEHGGSQTWWWRPGAPLALVMDTITPAAVYELPYPLTLQRGDSLEVELRLPPVTGLNGNPSRRMMNVGIALNGWAAIEG